MQSRATFIQSESIIWLLASFHLVHLKQVNTKFELGSSSHKCKAELLLRFNQPNTKFELGSSSQRWILRTGGKCVRRADLNKVLTKFELGSSSQRWILSPKGFVQSESIIRREMVQKGFIQSESIIWCWHFIWFT